MVERLCVAAMSGSATIGGSVAYSQITLGTVVVCYQMQHVAVTGSMECVLRNG